MRKRSKDILTVILAAIAAILICGCSLGDKNGLPPSDLTPDAPYKSITKSDYESNDFEGDTAIMLAESELPTEHDSVMLYVTGAASVALLSEGSYYSETAAYILCGDIVELISSNAETGYSYVYYEQGQVRGYIESNYLVGEKAAVCSGEAYFIRSDYTVMYSEADGSGAELETFFKDNGVTVLAKTSGGYWRVKSMYEETVGYVNVDFLSEKISGDEASLKAEEALNAPEPASETDTASVLSGTQSKSIDALMANAQSSAGGSWSSYVIVPGTGETLSSNECKMQAASLIKLYIMGAVYENYDELKSKNSDIDTLLYQMITVSDNTSANTLISLLGGGSSDAGKQAVNSYCAEHGFYNTEINRLLLEPNTNGDNYTSTGDCGRFLLMVYNGQLSHSGDMTALLKQQTRTYKIPAGIPGSVTTANKTGELDYVQNDAAIVYSDTPYIICIMSENLNDSSAAIQSIVDISAGVYEYVN